MTLSVHSCWSGFVSATIGASGRSARCPHARPGGISGMLEILSDRGGHDDIYHLADDLSFEIDDVLPIRVLFPA